MRNITVKKAELIDVMSKNREEHRELFLQAQKGYREQVIAMLDEELKLARDGRPFRLFRLTAIEAPQDHTAEYDRILGMLKMDTIETIDLTSEEYQAYVEDEWGWMASFANNATSYGVGSAKLSKYVQ